MFRRFWKRLLDRRQFLKESAAAGLLLFLPRGQSEAAQHLPPPHLFRLVKNDLYRVRNIPNRPFTNRFQPNEHAGVNALLDLMGRHNLKFYRSRRDGPLSGPDGLIAPDDVVLIKVNAQWKYRGCTNTDVIRGLIQKILDHPDGFSGEVVIFESGQGLGSLDCRVNNPEYYPDDAQHANANDETHSFLYLVKKVFKDSPVSAVLMDEHRGIFISEDDHVNPGYRRVDNVSYPCFTTRGGHRVELGEGLYTETGFRQNLKLINVPVLKDHFYTNFTCSLKNTYGILSMPEYSMEDEEERALWEDMHYNDPGQFFGKMMAAIKTPVLNIVDAIWVSQGDPLFSFPGGLSGYPPAYTTRVNQLLASQDPVALDYWAARYILYPIDDNPRHLPSSDGVNPWLTSARDTINTLGGLYDADGGIYVRNVTMNEARMLVHTTNLGLRFTLPGSVPRP